MMESTEGKHLRIMLQKVELAELTSALMGGLRVAHESDTETLKRIVTEYENCKYQGIPIPDSRKLSP